MEIAIVDIETTGLNAHVDAIIEIGIELVNTETFETTKLFDEVLMDNTWDIKKHNRAWIFSNSSLTPDLVEAARPLDDFREELQEIFNKYPITAYNKAFDTKFFRARNFILDDATCLLKMSFPYSTKLNKGGKKKRPSMEETYHTFFGDDSKPTYIEEHRAYADARDEAQILIHIIKDKGTDSFIDITDNTSNKKPATIAEIYEEYKITFGKHKGILLADLTTEDEIQYCEWVMENHFDTPNSMQSNKYLMFEHHLKVCKELPSINGIDSVPGQEVGRIPKKDVAPPEVTEHDNLLDGLGEENKITKIVEEDQTVADVMKDVDKQIKEHKDQSELLPDAGDNGEDLLADMGYDVTEVHEPDPDTVKPDKTEDKPSNNSYYDDLLNSIE